MAAISGSITEIINTHLARNEFNSQDAIVLITKQLIERNLLPLAGGTLDPNDVRGAIYSHPVNAVLTGGNRLHDLALQNSSLQSPRNGLKEIKRYANNGLYITFHTASI